MGQQTLHLERICLNKIPYAEKVQLNGVNTAISTSAETIWSPGATYAQLLTAAAMEAVSSSANDTAAGTGARTIRVTGIGTLDTAITEDVTLNGATPVALVSTYKAINSVKVLTAGSGLANAGNIDIRTVSGATVKNQISSGASMLGKSTSFLYTIPKSNVGLLSSINVTVSGATGVVQVYLLTKDSNGISFGEGEINLGISNTSINEGKGTIEFQNGLLIPEKTLIELRAITGAGAGILSAQAQLLVFDVKNFGFI